MIKVKKSVVCDRCQTVIGAPTPEMDGAEMRQAVFSLDYEHKKLVYLDLCDQCKKTLCNIVKPCHPIKVKKSVKQGTNKRGAIASG